MNCFEVLKRKSKGNLFWPVIIILFVVGGAVTMNLIAVRESIVPAVYTIKDQVDFANLAAYKEIDINTLSSTNQVTFASSNLNNVYLTFKSYLIDNLKLDSNLKPINQSSMVTSPYVIKQVIVYSIKNGLLSEWQYDDATHLFNPIVTDYSKAVNTPNNKTVTNTSIYTDVTFTLNLPYGVQTTKDIVTYTDMENK